MSFAEEWVERSLAEIDVSWRYGRDLLPPPARRRRALQQIAALADGRRVTLRLKDVKTRTGPGSHRETYELLMALETVGALVGVGLGYPYEFRLCAPEEARAISRLCTSCERRVAIELFDPIDPLVVWFSFQQVGGYQLVCPACQKWHEGLTEERRGVIANPCVGCGHEIPEGDEAWINRRPVCARSSPQQT